MPLKQKHHQIKKKYTLILSTIILLLISTQTNQLHASFLENPQTTSEILQQHSPRINPKILLNNYPSISPQNISITTYNSNQTQYTIKSTYKIRVHAKDIQINLHEYFNTTTNEITYINKTVIYLGKQYHENNNDLVILQNHQVQTLQNIQYKKYASKLLINSIQPLVGNNIFYQPKLQTQQTFLVIVEKNNSFSYQKQIISTEDYDILLIQEDNVISLLSNPAVIKISDTQTSHIQEVSTYAQNLFRKKSEDKIRILKLNNTAEDVVDFSKLRSYLDEDLWEIQPGQSSIYQQFITPNEPIIKQLASNLTQREAFSLASSWIWISDEKLHNKLEKWLLPKVFLLETPSYPNNPIPGEAVSDCSEQANTLVSLLRAVGVPPEDVRVALGKVNFDGVIGGHSWVEIKEQGKWLVLDPTGGPYYDDESERLIQRSGVSYEYWKYHPYPIVEIWSYYNDVYYTDENEEVAVDWSDPYNVFTESEIFSSLIFEYPLLTLLWFTIGIILISFVLYSIYHKRKEFEP